MKIIVLHGEDTTKSYARLTKFFDTAKSRGWDIITDQIPNTPSLFGTERLIVYRDYRLLTANDIKNFDRMDGTLVVYHTGDIPLTFIKKMPKDFKMEKFDVPKVLFAFLEGLYPGNAANSLKLLNTIVQTDPVELVFFFVAKHFRDLYWVLTDPVSTGFPGWKADKLKFQAKKFTAGQLKNLISKLAEIDLKVKRSEGDLLTHLDLLVIKHLQ
jgi:hypothetical protein